MTKIVFRAEGGAGQVVSIPEIGVMIGRNPTCDVPVAEPSVSGQHGTIRFEHGEWWIHDNNSSNGTYVNDVKVGDSVIRHGDILKFGSIEAEFQSVPETPPSALSKKEEPPVAKASVAVPSDEQIADTVSASVPPEVEKPELKLPLKMGLRPGLKLPPKPDLRPELKLPGKASVPETPAKPRFKLPGKASIPEAPAKPELEVPPKASVPETPAKPRFKLPGKASIPEAPTKPELKLPPKAELRSDLKLPEKVPAQKAREREEPVSAKPESTWKPPQITVDRDAPREEMAQDDVALISELTEKYQQIRTELAEVIIGQSSVVEEVMIAIFSRGHALLVGVPGLAKTLLISTLSHVLDLGFKRVQFTPDLMPSDITGTDVLEEDKVTGQREFRFVKGPLFTNMLLADEINRTPPKTQAALLEAMQEHHITVGSSTYTLPEPFFVLATQNPIEQEGTYPLPEAQLDRFLFNIVVDYPTAEEESRIIASVTGGKKPQLSQVLDGEAVLRIQKMLRRVPVSPHVIDFARNLARATRPGQPEAPDFVKEMVGWGAGPRAGISLIQSAKARAVLHGRYHVTTADVTAVAMPVLRHRVITTFAAEASGIKSDDVVRMLLKELKPREDLDI